MNENAIQDTIEKLSKIDYKKNPGEFDALADKLISDFILSQPEERRRKLEGMQSKINHKLSKFPTPDGR